MKTIKNLFSTPIDAIGTIILMLFTIGIIVCFIFNNGNLIAHF
jgi:hypothetical protein